jgi:transcriptional regulator with XRE-family HTH domain
VTEDSDIPAGGLTLGERLRRARRQRSLSAYLQKLEAGMVKHPSPNVLHQLARALNVGYAELMRLAGYVVPDEPAESERPRNELRYALSSEELTEEEAHELAEYLDWYRERHRK